MPKVLLIDDDIELCTLHKEYLEVEGFEVHMAFDGELGIEKTRKEQPDIVVLDVMMPGIDGVETLRRIRRTSNVPILMLTARGDDVDRIVGLELGADDYVAKPCTPRELSARLRAILRRVSPASRVDEKRPVEIGALRVEPARRQASWRGEPLELTSSELNLLEQLARGVGRVVSKEELSERALGRKLTRYDRSIDVHISHLRRKLGQLEDGRSPIQTIRGVGYQLVADPH
ncbi:MAG: response regulator transcription factor [Holophagales bacterium]|nr:response regulator transcription factor [Holophagales bacterium]